MAETMAALKGAFSCLRAVLLLVCGLYGLLQNLLIFKATRDVS